MRNSHELVKPIQNLIKRAEELASTERGEDGDSHELAFQDGRVAAFRDVLDLIQPGLGN